MIEIRPVTDIDELTRWRAEVIREVFRVVPGPELMERNRDYYTRHIAGGTHYAVVAECGGEAAGSGGLCISEELPSPDNPGGRCAYLMNIYVRKSYRQRGIATEIVRNLVEKAITLGCEKIYLESTDEAARLYRSAGFIDLPNMMKYAKTDV